jgi:hypothetical protein
MMRWAEKIFRWVRNPHGWPEYPNGEFLPKETVRIEANRVWVTCPDCRNDIEAYLDRCHQNSYIDRQPADNCDICAALAARLKKELGL